MAPEPLTHWGEEERRHEFGILDSAIALIGGDKFFKASWYWVNLANSSAESVILCSVDELGTTLEVAT